MSRPFVSFSTLSCVNLFGSVAIRMEGTNVDEGKRMLKESGLNFSTADSMGEAADVVVGLAAGAQ